MYGICKTLVTNVVAGMAILLAIQSSSMTITTEMQTTPSTVLLLYDECTARTGCKCVDLGVVIGVMCDNMTDYDKLRRTLKDIFGSNTSNDYEITLTGIRTLPPYAVRDLNITRLIFEDSSLETVSDEALKGVLRMKRFKIRTSSIRKVPNFRFVVHTLENLNLDSSLLTSVGDEVQNMSILGELTFRNNSIRSISPNAFLGLSELQTLDLSRNLLTFLPVNLLDGLKSLRMLCLSHNLLMTMKGVLTVVRPRFLLLDYNNLTDIDEIFPAEIPELETAQLNNNPFRNVTESIFVNKLPTVRFLFLDHCLLREFRFENLKKLHNITVLDLSSNLIEEIVQEQIDFGQSLQLYLDDNRISSFHGDITYTVRSISMSGNQMRRLGSTLTLRQLDSFEIERNRLEAISAEELRGMHGTTALNFRNNVISWIDRSTFLPLRNDLQNLDLSANRLTTLNGSVSYLSRLTGLNVSHNSIEFISKDDFLGLNDLSEIFMQNNKISVLQGLSSTVPQLQFLVIQYNNLKTVTPQQLPRKTLRFFYYKGNPIICNCASLNFLEWLEGDGSPGTDVTYCLSKNGNTNRLVSNISIAAPLNPSRCPQRCQCFCNQDYDHTLTVNCSSRGIRDPPDLFRDYTVTFIKNEGLLVKNQLHLLKTVRASWNSTTIRQNANSRYMIADNIAAVNLEANRITSLDNWTFPRNLKNLGLADNQLSRLPSFVMSLPVLKSLSLSGNPWSCDCKAVTFKKWLLSKMDVVTDYNNTRCAPDVKRRNLSKQLLVNLSDVDLCPFAIALYITIAFTFLTVLLIAAALKILYIRYELHVKVWLYAHGVTWVKEKDLDQDKMFDAFIAYGNGDDALVVDTIIPEIESRLPDIRLCFHKRNFLPGIYIHKNIANAVSYSKRTVLMLSKSFFESDWCVLEFQTAHQQSLEDKVQRIIVVKLGELPSDIDPTIQTYLDSVTYMEWGEKYFWDKLLYALPCVTKENKSYFCTPKTTTSMESLI